MVSLKAGTRTRRASSIEIVVLMGGDRRTMRLRQYGRDYVEGRSDPSVETAHITIPGTQIHRQNYHWNTGAG
jgi:hypothetical protein